MREENYNPRIGAYFTALSGERNKFPTGAPLIVCLYTRVAGQERSDCPFWSQLL